MKTIVNPPTSAWRELITRPGLDTESLTPIVRRVFKAVRQKGDKALSQCTLRYDGVRINNCAVSQEEIDQAALSVPRNVRDAMSLATGTITKFHKAPSIRQESITTVPGVTCWREYRPIEKVGIYIPGGTAPLFSTVLMLAIPAQIAGCREIVMCTPPGRDGTINPLILAAAKMSGISTVYKVGGIQSIAAMTFGTNTVPKVDKIFGPGNQYVTAAKQMAQSLGTAIDMPAGPSEVLIIADENADPDFVAADLLSQAEHGVDSQVLLLTTDTRLARATQSALRKQLKELPRQSIIRKALQNSRSVIFPSVSQCIQFSNAYAPEHLIIAVKNPDRLIPKIESAGSVFLGQYSCESAGDYASGTNHTLPTNGYARMYSGVTTESFMKSVSFQKLTASGLRRIGPAVESMAEAEQLLAHKMAVTIRLKKLEKGAAG